MLGCCRVFLFFSNSWEEFYGRSVPERQGILLVKGGNQRFWAFLCLLTKHQICPIIL
jgi:hypothetical protein